MPKNIPALKPRELVRILETGGCLYLREGKGITGCIFVIVKEGRELFQLIWEQESCPHRMSCVFLDNLVLPMKR